MPPPLSTATQFLVLVQDTPVRLPTVSTVNCCQPAGVSAYAAPLLSMAMQNAPLEHDSPVKLPEPVSTMDGLLQVPLASVSALPEWSTATQDCFLAQEMATSPLAESVSTLSQPPGGVDDRMAPVLSTA